MSTTTGADTALDLDAIEARANAATEGPWDVEDCEGQLEVNAGSARTQWTPTESGGAIGRTPSSWKTTDRIVEYDLETWDEGEDADDDQRRVDAEFIAHARTDIPALLAEVRRLRIRVISGDVEAVTAALDGLPVGSIITCDDRDQSWDSDMLTYQRGARENWFEVGVIWPRSSTHIARHQVPITVLREGTGA